MPLTPSSVKRSRDQSGDEILTFLTGDSRNAQGIVIIDENGEQVGIAARPLIVSRLDEYGTNDIEEASPTTPYIGKETAGGAWLIVRVDTSTGTSFRFATAQNNAGLTSYSEAWANRAIATYGTYSEAF